MERKIRLRCPTPGFAERFAKTLEACGFVVAPAGDADQCDEVLIYEVVDERQAPCARPAGQAQDAEKRPFLIYTETELGADCLSGCRDAGLVGVIRRGTAPEEVAFLVNRAIYCEKMLVRNPRAPVKVPVEVRSGHGKLKTVASQLSRDGMFIVTLSPLEAKSVCDIEFDIPGAGRPFKTRARVVYSIQVNSDLSIISNPADSFKRLVAHPGMAVYFLDLAQEDRALIDEYIETLL